jgi:hypothetical protein
MIKITVKIGRKADKILFIPHKSNLLTTGNKIKEISKAKAKGIRTVLAKIKIVKKAKTVATA